MKYQDCRIVFDGAKSAPPHRYVATMGGERSTPVGDEVGEEGVEDKLLQGAFLGYLAWNSLRR